MDKIKVLIDYKFHPKGFENLSDKFEFLYPEGSRFSADEVRDILNNQNVEVYIPSFSNKVNEELIGNAKNLKLVVSYGVGYDHIDVDYCTKAGIVVSHTPNSVLEPTAEVVLGLILATARRIGYYNNKLHNGERLDWTLYGDLGYPVFGTTLGILGLGRIGKSIAKKAKAFGMKVIYNNRKQLSAQEEKELDVTFVDFDTLISSSDFVSLNAPATPETHHIINAETIRKMKPSAFLINAARGSLVDEKALAEALKNNIIAGAGLDVFENEPKISPELFGLDNVVLTPHIGTKTLRYRELMQEEVAENIIGFYEGGKYSRVN